MIFWDDYDKRGTKILCDGCETNIKEAAKRALKLQRKPPLWKRLIWPGCKLNHMDITRQFSLGVWWGYEFVVTVFKGDTNPTTRLSENDGIFNWNGNE